MGSALKSKEARPELALGALTGGPRRRSVNRIWQRAETWLVVFMVVLGAYRLTLVDRGHFFWGDEIRYLRAGDALDDLAESNYRESAAHLFDSLGRPGFVFLSVIPTLVQRGFDRWFLDDCNNFDAYDVASIWNVAVSLAVTGVLFSLAGSWIKQSWYALFAAIVYSLLAQANVWIRHLVPYNESLLLFLLALRFLSVNGERTRSVADSGGVISATRFSALAGVLSAAGLATYPGHYAFVLINTAVAAAVVWRLSGCAMLSAAADPTLKVRGNPTNASFLRPAGAEQTIQSISTGSAPLHPWLQPSTPSGSGPSESGLSGSALGCQNFQLIGLVSVFGGYIMGAAIVVTGIEMAARFAGTSWIGGASQFSPTMGLFSEGFVFAWRYLLGAEGAIGALLFFGFVGCIALILQELVVWRRNCAFREGVRFEDKAFLGVTPCIAISMAAACYLFHGAAGVFLHQTVFYGRILLMYVPFVVIGGVFFVSRIPMPRLRRMAVTAMSVLSLWSFISFAVPYARLAYPADLWRQTMAERSYPAEYGPDVLYGSRDGSPSGLVDDLDSVVSMVADTQSNGSGSYIALASHEEARNMNKRFIGVNIRYLFYVSQEDTYFEPPSDYELIASAPHPGAFRVMAFEGHRPCERRRLNERQYTMRIYQQVGHDQMAYSMVQDP